MVWPCGVELPQGVPQGQPALGIESGGGLVEEQHGRPVEDGPGHHQPLGHAPRQGVDRGVGPLLQLELLQQLGGRPARLAGRRCRTAGRGSRGSPTPSAAGPGCSAGSRCRGSAWPGPGGPPRRCRPRRPGPAVGMTRVVSMPAVVVLPAPLGPSSPKISPGSDRQVEPVHGPAGPIRRRPWSAPRSG